MNVSEQLQLMVNNGPGGEDAGASLLGRTVVDLNGTRWTVTGWHAEGSSLAVLLTPAIAPKTVYVTNPVRLDAGRKLFGGVAR